MKLYSFSTAKFDDGTINEDAVIAKEHVIAVSDGAGGGGVYADKWSKYLLNNLPNKPICSFEQMDEWIAGIWEDFYNHYEKEAQKLGGMVLSKFYQEGSFATLAAIWEEDGSVRWVSYGDSVAFAYNVKTCELQHSFSELRDFNNPPYLINCKDELNPKGFNCGTFHHSNDCVYFVATDAVAHYLIMMYQLSIANSQQIESALAVQSKNSQHIHFAMNTEKEKLSEIILLFTSGDDSKILGHLRQKENEKIISHDDFSFAAMMLEGASINTKNNVISKPNRIRRGNKKRRR